MCTRAPRDVWLGSAVSRKLSVLPPYKMLRTNKKKKKSQMESWEGEKKKPEMRATTPPLTHGTRNETKNKEGSPPSEATHTTTHTHPDGDAAPPSSRKH